MATIEDFTALDIRTGKIIHAEKNSKAHKPTYILDIDFGNTLDVKRSSSQLCENYTESDLVGTQILAVVNFPPRRVAGVKLVLAVICDEKGTVLISPEQTVKNGGKLA